MKSLLAVAAVAVSLVSGIGCTHAPLRASSGPGEAPSATAAVSAKGLSADWAELVAFTTSFHPEDVDRSFNIALAARKLDGAIIAPGATFSFNGRVGARSLEAGFRSAPTLTLEGREPALGGGVCQVSSTVYNALLLADLALVQRYPHSRAVRYVAMGRDAAVTWRGKDLKFNNPHGFPVAVRAEVEHGRLTVRVLAPEVLDHEVRLVVGDREPASPRNEFQMLESPEDLNVVGYWVRLYRERRRDGSLMGIEPVGDSTFYPFKRRPTP